MSLENDMPSEIPTSIQILDTVLHDLTNRKGFKEEYQKIEDQVRADMRRELIDVINSQLNNMEIPTEERAASVAKAVLEDLSDRRGLRQGFFDQLFFDDEAVQEYKKQHPDIEITDDQSRTGIVRQLTSQIEGFDITSTH